MKGWAGNLALMFGGLAVGFLLFEIVLRIAGISYPSFYIKDERIGSVLRPDAEGWYRQEGEALVRINSEGLRDEEHAKVKPANTFRIAVLGDSYAGAFHVPMEKAFWAVFERDLNECDALAGKAVEVINFGVSGYGTAQELATLRYRAWDYDPDMILLAFVTGNDVRNNSAVLEDDPSRLYFIYSEDELVPDTAFTESDSFQHDEKWYVQLRLRIIESSRVLQLARRAKNGFLEKLLVEQELRSISDETVVEVGLDSMVYLEPGDPDWTEAWRITEDLVTLMNSEVTEMGAEFLVVTLSNGIQVHPEPQVREDFMRSLGVDDLLYADLRIKALGERSGFSVLNLAQPFRAFAEEHQVFLHGFENAVLGEGHWNLEGHSLAGQLIAQQMCAQLAK